ncbi:MAG TPA: FMN-binding protein [Clostridia bacterium]|nr:FMN-binding protein [Clostridia bacterium]
MKRIVVLLLAFVLILSLGACAGKEETPEAVAPEAEEQTEKGDLADGIYFAMEDEFADSGWKSTVTLKVEGGEIVSADWNAVNILGGVDKKTFSKDGDYGMKEFGNAQSHWHEQAQEVEAYLVQTQDPTAIEYKDDEGHTDAIAGVSVHVNDFFELAKKALDKEPIELGQYEDGAYHAQAKEFVNGWKDTVDLTVLNGHILSVSWDGISEEDPEITKKTASADGSYGMKEEGNAQSHWHEQAQKAEAYLLETQDPRKIDYSDDQGHTDAISGVSIGVNGFFDLAKEALEK